MRDRRFDHLYDLRKQPVKDVILDRFADEFAERVRAWPPPDLQWESEELRRRHEAGVAAPPRDEVLRLALELSRLDLLREHEAYDEALRNRASGTCRGPAEEQALRLLALYVTEECLALKEWAEGARLSRADLCRAVEGVERRLFRVTLS